MAHVEQLDITGLKGATASCDMGRKVLAIGPPGSGKTSLADALRYAAIGYVPLLGKEKAATARLMSGPIMSSTIRLSDGRTVTRMLQRKGKGTAGTCSVSTISPNANATEHSAAAAAMFGSDAVEAAEHLDLRSLLNATPNERAKRIESLLDATQASIDRDAYLGLYVVNKMLGNPDPGASALHYADVPSWESTLPLLDEPVQVAVRWAMKSIESWDAQDRPEALLDHVTTLLNRAQAHVRQRRAARTEIEDRIGSIQTGAGNAQAVRAQRQKAAGEMAVIQDRLSALHQQRAEHDEQLCEHQRLKDELSQLPTEADLIARVEQARSKVETATIPDPFDEEVPEAVLDASKAKEAQKAYEEVRDNAPVMPQPLRPYTEMQAESYATAIVEHALKARDAIIECINTKPNVSLIDAPGVNTALGALWHACDKHIEAREEQAAVNARARAEHDRKVKEYGKAASAHNAATKAVKAAYDEWVRITESEERALATAVEEWTARRDQHNAAIEDARRSRDELANLHTKAMEEQGTLNNRRAWVVSRLESLAEITSPPTDGEVAAQANRMAALDAEVKSLDETLDVIEQAAARQHELHAIAQDIIKSEAEAGALRALKAALVALREQDMADRAGPLTERMRRFLGAAGRPETPYLIAENRKVDFGWIRHGQRIHVSALSGGETVLFTAALAASIIDLRKPDVRCLLIEGAELGLDLCVRLIDALDECSDMYDTALICTVTTAVRETVSDEWRVLEFGQ